MAQRDIDTAELHARPSATSTFGDDDTAGDEGRFASEAARLEAAAPIILALEECDAEVRSEAIALFEQLGRKKLDKAQRFATLALLSDMLVPDPAEKIWPGIDLAEAEAATASRMAWVGLLDEAEAVFAERVRDLMEAKGLTQAELAAKVGIGQPAISMMLSRPCRPQRKTVLRFAEALEVSPEMLWPATHDLKELLDWHARHGSRPEKPLPQEEQQREVRTS